MSAFEVLVNELRQQPDSVASQLLDYLHALVPESPRQIVSPGNFSTYWSRHYGAFDGEEWEEVPEQLNEERETW